MQITPTEHQQEALKKIQDFLNTDIEDIFILKGYAGTGKSTLIKFVVDYLNRVKISYSLLAPTGKAAKVLRDKIGEGRTIHQAIYSKELCCLKTDAEDVSEKEYHYFFPVRQQEDGSYLLIIDEASMISDYKDSMELMTFGTGRLLSDILWFMNTNGVKKILFVGDPAQLPPVTDNCSLALDATYLKSLGFHVTETTLTEILRQKADSGIAKLSLSIRDLLATPEKQRNTFVLEANGTDVFRESKEHFFETFVRLYTDTNSLNAVMIAYSNRQCLLLNEAIRQKLFPNTTNIQVNDTLIINNNVYRLYHRDIFNGDMVKVVAVGSVESRTVAVNHCGRTGKVALRFRNVTLQYPGDEIAFHCKIHESMLSDPERDLDLMYKKALYIDFCMRWREAHPTNDPQFKEGSMLFVNALSNDPYFNALKVKYGYAITCHKAQGSEWDYVFVDYTGRSGLFDDAVRWCYTATTRAQKKLYMAEAPNINGFTQLNFLPVKKASKACADFFSTSIRPENPEGPAGAPVGVALKYAELRTKLQNTGIILSGSESFPYRERFHFQMTDGNEVQIDASYDKNGIFKKVTETGSDEQRALIRLFNAPYIYPVQVAYEASSDVLKNLFQLMQAACIEVNAAIVQVKEMLSQYYVLYGLKTDATFAYIQFYITENGALSTAIPLSEDGEQDEKLIRIIHYILREDVV